MLTVIAEIICHSEQDCITVLDSFNNIREQVLQDEPYRVCRRVNILRDYADEKTKLYPRNQRKSGSITN